MNGVKTVYGRLLVSVPRSDTNGVKGGIRVVKIGRNDPVLGRSTLTSRGDGKTRVLSSDSCRPLNLPEREVWGPCLVSTQGRVGSGDGRSPNVVCSFSRLFDTLPSPRGLPLRGKVPGRLPRRPCPQGELLQLDLCGVVPRRCPSVPPSTTKTSQDNPCGLTPVL